MVWSVRTLVAMVAVWLQALGHLHLLVVGGSQLPEGLKVQGGLHDPQVRLGLGCSAGVG